jgi:predicted nucleotidyltransferase
MKLLGYMVWIFFCASAIQAQQYLDVLNTDAVWRKKTLSILQEYAKEIKLEHRVVDYGIVGSFAQGVARGKDHTKPSDIDFILWIKNLTDKEFDNNIVMWLTPVDKYCARLKEELNLPIESAIIVASDRTRCPNQPNAIFFSLTEDKMYNRPNNEPRNVKLIYHKGTWYAFDREKWNTFTKSYTDKSVLKPKSLKNGKLAYVHTKEKKILITSD